MDFTLLGMMMLRSFEQSLNEEFPMLVTPSLMVTLVSDLQFAKVPSGRVVTLPGMVMLVSDEQRRNAFCPMDFTLSGMVMLVSDEQP